MASIEKNPSQLQGPYYWLCKVWLQMSWEDRKDWGIYLDHSSFAEDILSGRITAQTGWIDDAGSWADSKLEPVCSLYNDISRENPELELLT